MVEEGNNAFDVQLDTTMKNAALFDRNSKDKVQHRQGTDGYNGFRTIEIISFSMEYRELLRTLDNDESVRTFMDGKLNERGEMAQVRDFRGSQYSWNNA